MRRAIGKDALDRIIEDLHRKKTVRGGSWDSPYPQDYDPASAQRDSIGEPLTAYEERNRHILQPEAMPVMPQVVEVLRTAPKPEDLEKVREFLAALSDSERRRIIKFFTETMQQFSKAAVK